MRKILANVSYTWYKPLGKRPNKSIGESEDARLCLLLIWRRLLRPGFLGLLIFILNFGSSSLDIENMTIGSPGVSDIISEMKGLSEKCVLLKYQIKNFLYFPTRSICIKCRKTSIVQKEKKKKKIYVWLYPKVLKEVKIKRLKTLY